MTKKGTTAEATPTGRLSLDVKKARRAAQSEADRAAAVAANGYVPKRVISDNDRCGVCNNPSAQVRKHRAKVCLRCDRRNNPSYQAAKRKAASDPANGNANGVRA